jgi:hypothetical protein
MKTAFQFLAIPFLKQKKPTFFSKKNQNKLKTNNNFLFIKGAIELKSSLNDPFINRDRPNLSALMEDKDEERDKMFDTILQELSAIQQNAPRRVAILGTRHFSFLHQQIVELLTYANVLIGNHVFTSGGAGTGTNAAVIRGALRAEKPELLTVVLPQILSKQPPDVRELLEKVENVIEMSENDDLPLDIASRLCNSNIIGKCEHLISFAFHDSVVVLEAVREAKSLNKLVTLLFLD